MHPSTDQVETQATLTLTGLVAWQNRWLTERFDFLRSDLQHCLDTREPAAEEAYRRWLHELALTRQLLLPLSSAPTAPDELMYLLQATRHQWEAQFPENIRAVVRHAGEH